MSQLVIHDVEYFHKQERLLGYFCAPGTNQGQTLPGILLVHGAAGINQQMMDCSQRLAALGYAVLALDLWGERRQLRGPEQIGAMLGRFASDRTLWMQRFSAGHQALLAQASVDSTRLGAIGYCFGGTTVLEAIRYGIPLQGVVSLHGGLDLVGDDWSAASRAAQALICTGADDVMAKADDLQRVQQSLSAADIRWQTELFSHTRHAFTELDHPHTPPFAAYNARADRRSWQTMQAFFTELFL